MSRFLDECCNDAWDVIQGRKKIVDNRIIDISEGHEENINKTEYGWLEPNGTFNPVEFGNHQAWASEYLLDLYRKGKIDYDKIKLGTNQDAGDILAEKGWVLIHCPHQIVKITRNETKRLTKMQKDFLYEYLCKKNRQDEAIKILEE